MKHLLLTLTLCLGLFAQAVPIERPPFSITVSPVSAEPGHMEGFTVSMTAEGISPDQYRVTLRAVRDDGSVFTETKYVIGTVAVCSSGQPGIACVSQPFPYAFIVVRFDTGPATLTDLTVDPILAPIRYSQPGGMHN